MEYKFADFVSVLGEGDISSIYRSLRAYMQAGIVFTESCLDGEQLNDFAEGGKKLDRVDFSHLRSCESCACYAMLAGTILRGSEEGITNRAYLDLRQAYRKEMRLDEPAAPAEAAAQEIETREEKKEYVM